MPQKDSEENKSNKEESVPPDWVKHFLKEKNGDDQSNRKWNKVMIMDPPTIQTILEE